MDKDDYSIQELCERSGLPRRTIHFYTQQGILPPPIGAGLAARYTRLHLLRLELIPLLRAQGLRLDQIRQKFQQHSHAELETLRGQLKPAVLPAASAPQNLQPAHGPAAAGSYRHYPLPGGILLIIPESVATAGQEKLDALLAAARIIFGSDSRSNTSQSMEEE